jgi:TetR/AcrR family transcriptional repressor of nem operon
MGIAGRRWYLPINGTSTRLHRKSSNAAGQPTAQVGTFSLETSQSKLLREAGRKFQEWRAPFASCIAEAQIAGEIDSTFDPTDLAEFLLASLEGAILGMKVERGPAALDRFKNIIFRTVFKESKNESPL